MSGSPDGPRWVVAGLWFVVLALAATGPALFGARSLGPESVLDFDLLYVVGDRPRPPPFADLSRAVYDLPRDFAAAEGFRAGRFDLWNPRVAMGQPLWAEGGAPLFPLKLPFYLAPSRRTYDWAAALRLVVAGMGAYLLARRRRLGFLPAIAAGSLFELSGGMIAMLPFGQGAPPSLLPWVVLGAEGIARERRLAAAAGTGIALGVTANSGHPMLVLVVFAGFGAAIAGHAFVAWRRPRVVLAIGALATLAMVLGLAIGAPGLLPTLEAWDAGRLYKSTSTFGWLVSWNLLQVRNVLPIALFSPGLLVPVRADLGKIFPFAVTPAVGVLGFLLALAGIAAGGLDAPLVAIALLGVGLMFAPYGLGWVRRIPPLTLIYPMYCAVLVALPLAQAAGRGVAILSTSRARAAVLTALALVLAGTLSLTRVEDLFPSSSFFSVPLRTILVRLLSQTEGQLRLAVPLAVATASTAWITFAARRGVTRRGAVLLAALATCELVATLPPTVWWPDSKVLASPSSPAVRFVQARLADGGSRILGVGEWIGHPATPSLFGLADIRGYAALPVERYVRYLEAIEPNANWYVSQVPGGVTRHPLLDLAAVRYVIAAGSPEPPLTLDGDPALRRVYRDGAVAIYENTAALPRARIVHSAAAVGDAAEAFARLREAAATGPHAASTALAARIIVEPSTAGQPPPAAPESSPAPGEQVTIADVDDPDRVELIASLASPGWVVLADTFYPGWTATIDGVAATIHPADLMFRAVFVPAGQHRIVFHYGPRSLRLGLALAVVGLAASVLLLARGGRTAKRARAAGP